MGDKDAFERLKYLIETDSENFDVELDDTFYYDHIHGTIDFSYKDVLLFKLHSKQEVLPLGEEVYSFEENHLALNKEQALELTNLWIDKLEADYDERTKKEVHDVVWGNDGV